MSSQEIYNTVLADESFLQWEKCQPTDLDYVKYGIEKPYVIAAAHKMHDTYFSFCMARSFLLDFYSTDFGELAQNDDVSVNYFKSQLLYAFGVFKSNR